MVRCCVVHEKQLNGLRAHRSDCGLQFIKVMKKRESPAGPESMPRFPKSHAGNRVRAETVLFGEWQFVKKR